MKYVLNSITGDSLRHFDKNPTDLTPSITKKEAIRNWIKDNPNPDPDECPNLVLTYTISAKNTEHNKFYQLSTGLSFLDKNYFQPDRITMTPPGYSYTRSYIQSKNANYYEIKPEPYFNHTAHAMYSKVAEDYYGYRMLELSIVKTYAGKANKTSNCDKRVWNYSNELTDPNYKQLISGTFGITYALPTARLFMFYGDTHVYDEHGNIAWKEDDGKFYNKTVLTYISKFAYGVNYWHVFATNRMTYNLRLFALGTERDPKAFDFNFNVGEWYRTFTPRTVSAKTAKVNATISEASKFTSLEEIEKIHVWKQKLSQFTATSSGNLILKNNFAYFQHFDDDWDVIRVFDRRVNLEKDSYHSTIMPTVRTKVATTTTGSWYESKSQLYYYAEESLKVNPKYASSKTIDDFEIPCDITEIQRHFIHRKNKQTKKLEYDSITKAWNSGTSSSYLTDRCTFRLCDYINMSEMSSNTHLADIIKGINKVLSESSSPSEYEDINLVTLCTQSVKSPILAQLFNKDYMYLAKIFRAPGWYESHSIACRTRDKLGILNYKSSMTLEEAFGLSTDKMSALNDILKKEIDYYTLEEGRSSSKIRSYGGLSCSKLTRDGFVTTDFFNTENNSDYLCGFYNLLKRIYTPEEIKSMTTEEYIRKIKILVASSRLYANEFTNRKTPNTLLLPGTSSSFYASHGLASAYDRPSWKQIVFKDWTIKSLRTAIRTLERAIDRKDKTFFTFYLQLGIKSAKIESTWSYSTIPSVDGLAACNTAINANTVEELIDLADVYLRLDNRGITSINIDGIKSILDDLFN